MSEDVAIERLLTPVSEDAPAGENLEYDAAFSELERAAAGKEERYSGGKLIPAEDPDWSVVLELAKALLGRTKDLRVAVQLARAQTALSGLDGLAGGIEVLRGLLERYWEGVHPKLETEDDYDPIFRINALASLADPAGVLGVLRKTCLVDARSVGRFTFRDLDIAEERIAPPEGESAPGLDLLKAALREAGTEYASAGVATLERATAGLEAIEALFRERAKDAQAPDLDALKRAIGCGIAFLRAGIEEPQGVQAASSQMTHAANTSLAGGAIGPLRSRDDVRRVLAQVCDFLESTEPSNPAPLLIKRAQRLLDRSFVDIIQDLAPEAIGQIEKLAGTAASETSG